MPRSSSRRPTMCAVPSALFAAASRLGRDPSGRTTASSASRREAKIALSES